MKLKVLSWNVLIFNKRLEEALVFLRDSKADIICLQEVPDALLEKLRLLPYSLVTGIDAMFVSDAQKPQHGETKMSLVILSKFPIEASREYLYEGNGPGEHPQRKIYHAILHALGAWKGGATRDRGALSADMRMGGELYRIFCVHLSLSTPAIRQSEFVLVKKNLLPNGRNLIVGDFNILDSFLLKPLNWVQGASIRSALPWSNERGKFQTLFSTLGFLNPHRGKVTCPISQSQLDHILLPKVDTSVRSEVIKKKYGSDHNPISVEIQLHEK
jgi:endonuclease/exonuclease/phosphatase family metal-dependent hydrolase